MARALEALRDRIIVKHASQMGTAHGQGIGLATLPYQANPFLEIQDRFMLIGTKDNLPAPAFLEGNKGQHRVGQNQGS